MAQASRFQQHRKRSLSTAFRASIHTGLSPPLKRLRTDPAQLMSDEKNDTKFIIGCNKTQFHVIGELYSNQSQLLRDLIQTNTMNDRSIVSISDIDTNTFEFITDFVYLRNPNLTLHKCIDVLVFAVKYEIVALIEICRKKLSTIDGNIDDWYHIMTSFEKHSSKTSLQPYISYFIENNALNDMDHITFDSRFYDLNIHSIIDFIKYCTEFDGEHTKLLCIYRYLLKHKSGTNKSSVYEVIQKYFVQYLDFRELIHWSKTNPNDELMHVIRNCYQIQNNNGNQANPRRCNVHKTPTHTVLQLSDNDKKQRAILLKYGLRECIKIESTNQGAIWRAISARWGQHVVIKTALQIYCDIDDNDAGIVMENIMNEANILREMNKKQILCTDEDIRNGIIHVMDVIQEEFVCMLILEYGGCDLFDFTRHCHEDIERGNILISDWQKTSRLIAYKLAKIIDWLHSHNVVHLDVSLENVLISNVEWIYDQQLKKLNPNFTLKLIDFGASQKRENDKLFKSKLRIGKPGFCSPQIFKKCMFNGKASDCWSYGVTLFTLIIGATPWQTPSDENTLFQSIVLDKNMDKILRMWKRRRYLTANMEKLLNTIFVINEEDRACIEDIKHNLQ